MFGGVIHKEAPDEDWSVWDEYKAEMLAVVGIKKEYLLENVIDFDRMALENKHINFTALREQYFDAQRLGLPVRVRMVPANG